MKLIYAAIASLDGYVADVDGKFDWAAPDAEVHAFVNDLERPVGTYLYGRRMYETMLYWADPQRLEDDEPVARDFARIWQAADKVIYSTTLESPSTPRTRIERRFDADAIRRLKAEAARDLTIGGAQVAGQALLAGVVDELQLILVPVLVGGGARALPDGIRVELELREQRRFDSGAVFLRYAVVRGRS
jgi:dihydrofolate reductase